MTGSPAVAQRREQRTPSARTEQGSRRQRLWQWARLATATRNDRPSPPAAHGRNRQTGSTRRRRQHPRTLRRRDDPARLRSTTPRDATIAAMARPPSNSAAKSTTNAVAEDFVVDRRRSSKAPAIAASIRPTTSSPRADGGQPARPSNKGAVTAIAVVA